MPFNKPSQRKTGAVILLFVFGFWISFAALFGAARPVRAQYVDPLTSVQTTLSNVWNKLSDAMVEGVSVALANAANYFLSQLAYQIAVGIVSGCPGQKPCTVTSFLGDAVKNAGEGALGEAIGTLSKEGGFEALGINLCAPPSANFGLSIQLGLLDEAKPPKPKCDFNQVMSNWKTAAASLSPDELQKNLWQGFKPGSQPLSMSLHATSNIKMDILYEKEKKLKDQLAKLSGTGGFEAVTDPVTKKVRTPAAAVKAEFERGEREKNEYPKIFQQIQNAGQTARGSVWGSILMNAAQTFGQTLLAQAWNKLVNKLFASQESPEGEVAPPELIRTEEGIVTVGATEQAAALSPKYSAPPLLEVGIIDPLAQFSVCNAGSRGPWNCVADTQLATGVRLGNSVGMTVAEALQKKYLHGDWALVPAADKAKNASDQCFSSAYCEGNLKKLRAARILPIGWEIAASLSKAESPYKLQDAIDNFENPTHPLYHLIDPGWVLKQPLTMCKSQVFGQTLMSPSIPSRAEVCVDAPTCLREDDGGQCIGGYGYCTREKNVWRFNGDSCPEQFNTCRTLKARVGNKKVNYITNTIERGVCNASNVGCKAYSTTLNSFSCTLSNNPVRPDIDPVTNTCRQTGGCTCVNNARCQVNQDERTCINPRGELCSLPESACTSSSTNWGLDQASKCRCDISYSCNVPVGSRTCSTIQGSEVSTGDDWLETPAKYFNKAVEQCAVDKNGCSALIKLAADQALNLVKNGGFEELEDGDADGEPDHAKYWSPFGKVPAAGPGATIRSSSTVSVIDGGVSLRVGPTAGATQTTCNNPNCASEQGCACPVVGNPDTVTQRCKVYKGSPDCTITNRVVQDRIQVQSNRTYTFSAVFKKDNPASASTAELRLKFKDGAGNANVSLAAIDVSAARGTDTYNCGRTADGGLGIYDINSGGGAGSNDFDTATNLARVSCSFMITVPVSSASLEIVGTNALVDNVMLVEGTSTAFHEGYGVGGAPVYAKVPPKYLNCSGESTDRPECKSFSAACRENELGCDLYSPSSGDPAIPGVTGPKDRCPEECVGYDVFKQGVSDFERREKFPVYFIPSSAKACSEAENGCSEFTDIQTEQVAYYSQIRLCQLPDAGDNQVFYSWEGSDTAGYQLKVWNLKRTAARVADTSAAASVTDVCANSGQRSCAGGTNAARACSVNSDCPGSTCTDVCLSGSAGTAPCTKLDTVAALNSFGTPQCVDNPADRDGLCSRADIDTGNFDCREFYDEFGNKHYRLLSRTILAAAECRRYRITVSTPTDCTDSNGKWDDAKKECVYLASMTDSNACSAAANGCRSYKGNAATAVRNLAVDDFESSLDAWDINPGTYASPGSSTISPESVNVGGHSLKISLASPTAFRDVTKYVSANQAYSLSFWARGSGKLSIKFVDYAGGALTCSVANCSGETCKTCVHPVTGLTCQNAIVQASGSWSCTIPNRSSMNPSTHDAYIPFSDKDNNGNRCSNNLTGPACVSDAACGTGRCIRVQVVTLSTEWKQYAVGPVIVTDAYFGRAPVGIQVTTQGLSDVYIDKFVLKEAKDNLYVVRDSWKTPLTCDQTADGQSSPLEMLGCREYTNKATDKVTLRSFSKLCREQSVGCAAFSLLQGTPENYYEETYNAVCKIASVCTSVNGSANCVCNYNLDHAAKTSLASSPVLPDVCRVAIGEKECRFHLKQGQDSFASRSVNRDILSIPADERQYLVASAAMSCTAKDAGCKTFGQANVIYEGTCSVAPGLACSSGSMKVCAGGARKNQSCSTNVNCPDSTCGTAKLCAGGTSEGLVCTANADCPGSTCSADIFVIARQVCLCTDAKTGGKCEIPAGEASCKFSPEKGLIKDWKAAALKDDPSKYEQILCREIEGGCEEYTADDGAWYFKDPGNKTCTYKENMAVGGVTRSGWFRQTEAGTFACYPELVKNGTFFEMYRNKDVSCSRADKCSVAAGCPCFKPADLVNPVCVIAQGKTECGFVGWVGQCEAKYNMCEEFIDPLATTSSHPAGEPYYYIVNSKLDKTSCAGSVNLKQGCVLFKQTSNAADTFSAPATYYKAIREVGSLSNASAGVNPENCDLSNRNTNYCSKRCFSIANGLCHSATAGYTGEGRECWQDDTGTYGCPAGGTCQGKIQYGIGCQATGDCNAAKHEVCKTDPGRTFTVNDTNLILKVRRDRECGQWLTCMSESTTWDDAAKKWRSTCTDYTSCERASQLGQTMECIQYVEPDKKILIADKNAAASGNNYSYRDVTWSGLDFSGYSLYRRYPVQYLQPIKLADATKGVCVSTGTSEEGSTCLVAGGDGKCSGGFCSQNPLAMQRFGVKINTSQCDPANNSATDGSNPACPDDTSLGGKGRGTCYAQACYYSLTGGTVDYSQPENATSCRAYPEEDAPFGAMVLDGGASLGYDHVNKTAKTLNAAFKNANVCSDNNYCECSYKRITYGKGQGVRYFGLTGTDFKTGEIEPIGVCSGGARDGKPCGSGTGEDCKTGLDAVDAGRCVGQSQVLMARGWPGFCVDRDSTMTVNNDARQGACNLWLPVDQLSGMPSRYNQYTQSGYIGPADSQTMYYCQAQQGTKMSGGVYEKRVRDENDDYGSHGSTWDLGNWFAISGQDAARGTHPMSSHNAYRNTLAAVRIWLGGQDRNNTTDSGYIYLAPENNWEFGLTWNSNTPPNGANGLHRTDGTNGWYSPGAATCKPLLTSGNPEGDCEGINGSNAQVATCQTKCNSVDPAQCDATCKSNCLLNCPGNPVATCKNTACTKQPSCDAACVSSCQAACDSVGGGQNCLYAQGVFDGNGKLTGVATVMCHNASTSWEYVQTKADLLVRENCTSLVNTNRTDGEFPNVVWTDRMYKASANPSSTTAISGFAREYATAATARPGLTSSVTAPFGHGAAPNTAYGTSVAARTLQVPVWSSEGGSDFTIAHYDPGTTAWTLQGDPAIVAGKPFSTNNAAAGATLLQKAFATSWNLYTWNNGTSRYDSGTPWDIRNNSSLPPVVVPVNSDNCADTGGTLLCAEAGKCGSGVNAGRFCVSNADCAGAVCETVKGITANGIIDQVDLKSPIGAGKLKVTMKYYAYADKDHMPIRRVTVDFGDGSPLGGGGTGYYKNHRGAYRAAGGAITATDAICNSVDEWGKTSDTCESNYFEEVKTYLCNAPGLLPACAPKNTQTEKYPCSEGGACVFRPRVQVIDNWGLCNGNCPGGVGPSAVCANKAVNSSTASFSNGDECVPDFRTLPITSSITPWTWFSQRIFVYPPSN